MAQSGSNAGSKVVFVGNVPYGMTEEQLEDVFKTVGPVVGIRLVFDRESGKPKGYGFCEFMDHETAASAVRNLHGFEVEGRPLRVDLAESDPMVEGRSTHQGELTKPPDPPPATRWGPVKNDFANFMNGLPSGVPVPPGKSSLDVISEVLAAMPYSELVSVLSQMKAYVANYPDRARALLVAHPQLSYAFFQAMLMHKIVDQSVLERMLKASTGGGLVPAAPAPAPPPPVHQPAVYPPPLPQPAVYPPPPPQAPLSYPPPQNPGYYGMPPPPQPQHYPPQQQGGGQYGGGVPLDDDQKRMILQVMSLTPQQIEQLPPHEREGILRLRAQLGGFPTH